MSQNIQDEPDYIPLENEQHINTYGIGCLIWAAPYLITALLVLMGLWIFISILFTGK
jgi:hypothetical protein